MYKSSLQNTLNLATRALSTITIVATRKMLQRFCCHILFDVYVENKHQIKKTRILFLSLNCFALNIYSASTGRNVGEQRENQHQEDQYTAATQIVGSKC